MSGIVERHADLLAGELRLGNDEQKIEAAEVLVRIYELERHDDALVEAITFATNSQNPVDLRDLRANDRRQQDLATSISGLGYGTGPSVRTGRRRPTSSPAPRSRKRCSQSGAAGRIRPGSGAATTSALQRLAAAFRRADLVDLLEPEAEELR